MAPKHLRVVASLFVAVAAGGCTQNPFRAAPAMMPVSFAPQAPSVPLSPSPLPSYANADPKALETQLARSRQETNLVQEEVSALREQLASTSSQLAQARAAARPAGPPGTFAPPGDPGSQPVPTVPAIDPASMREGMNHLAIPGVTSRLDGAVVRIEIPADKLFEPGTASLLPAGAALLSQTATEVSGVFKGQFIGIEGHTDTEPLQNATWGSPHQLSVARASAVFDFLCGRTTLKPGQLFVVAHGPNHPVVSNATAAGRARNRRVELVVYPEQTAAEPVTGMADAPGAG
ncbi:MAG: OmpA family protein [Planctomycetota bacterium]|nr:OmpA family protein [Planctomycetota bacterium]